MAIVNLGKFPFKIKGTHIASNAYERLDLVQDNVTKTWYLSLWDVPENIGLTNQAYWVVFFNASFSAQQLADNAQNMVQILNNKYKIKTKTIPDNSDLNNYKESGFFKSVNSANTIANIPSDMTQGAFTLTVTGISDDEIYSRQTLEDVHTSRSWARVQTSYSTTDNWTDWERQYIEKGSTANGHWVKYPDRSLVQYGVYTTNSSGNGWVNMPISFASSVWRLFCTPVQTGFGLNITLKDDKANDHTATIKSRKSATDEAVPVSLDWIAIGEW